MAQQSQQQSGDNSMSPIWITASIIIVAYVIWAMGHKQIVSFLFYLNIWEARFINFFIEQDALSRAIYIMQTVDPNAVTWDELMLFVGGIGDYARYPIVVVLSILAAILYRSDITLRFRRAHDMKTLRAQEQYNWPAIMPIVKQDLVSEDINVGPWAMALTPIEFARKYQLLKKEDLLMDNPIPGEEMTGGIRRGDAKRVFTLQLGPYWDGFDRCPPHARVLAAIFLARINRDRGSAIQIMEELDKSSTMGKPNYSIANSVIKKYQQTELVQEIVDKHAYLLTVLASLLFASRDDGVVPSSEFLWLKPVDRRLWYMLNCVGRQTPFAEVSGPFAHWKAEKAMGRRSLVPMIDEAIKALEIAVKEVKLSPKELKGLQP